MKTPSRSLCLIGSENRVVYSIEDQKMSIAVEGHPRPMPRYMTDDKPGAVWFRSLKSAFHDIRMTEGDVLGAWLEDGALLDVEMTFSFPTSDMSRWGMLHDARPDIDNLEKLVLDTIQTQEDSKIDSRTMLVDDDCSVARVRKSKVFGKSGGLLITFRPISRCSGMDMSHAMKDFGMSGLDDFANGCFND